MFTKNTQIHSEERITGVNRPKGSAIHKHNTFNIFFAFCCVVVQVHYEIKPL